VQVDEPYMQARAEKAKQHGVQVLDRALAGVTGTTAVHICFGYAAVIHNRPPAYSFLPEFEASKVQQISIETAQAKLDCAVLEKLPSKTILLGGLDLGDLTVETPAGGRRAIRRGLAHVSAQRIAWRPTAASSTCRARWPSARCAPWWRAPPSCGGSSRCHPGTRCRDPYLSVRRRWCTMDPGDKHRDNPALCCRRVSRRPG
jgi:hypothetical protein